MLCSRGQRLLMMDADGATKVSDLERLEAKLADITSERLRCAVLLMWCSAPRERWWGKGARYVVGLQRS